MNSTLVKKYIDTVADLNQFVQRKRFRVDGESEYIFENPVATAINDEIRLQHGLDLALINSEDDLFNYGAYLQDKLNSAIREFYFNSSIVEERELIEAAKEVSVDTYLRNDLTSVLKDFSLDPYSSKLAPNENFTRQVIKAIGVTVPSFLFSIKHPEKVHLIDLRSKNDYKGAARSYLVSSKIRVKNKEVFMLTELIEHYRMPLTLCARGCFFFEQRNKRVKSPTRMFIQGINEYGNEIDMEGIKRKFFLSKNVDNAKTLIKDGLSFKILGYRGDMTLFFSIAEKGEDARLFQFAYMLLKDEIISDTRKGLFL